jgi:hypothetical protein
MPDKKPGFMMVAMALFILAFAVGFFIALVSIGKSGVLYKLALSWETTKSLLYLAAWAPAILLVASALAMESSEARDGFSGAAYRIMIPALSLAAIVSIFYILIVPGLEERKGRYESQSQLFTDSLRLAAEALKDNRLDEAEKFLLDCAAIDIRDDSYVALNDRVKSAGIKASALENAASPRLQATQPVDEVVWKAGNRFYLEALEARSEGRTFDAHYLAKRSAAVYSKRPEVKRLVEETWRDLQQLGPSAETKAAAAYYERKLEGYQRFQENDFLQAYRIFTELGAINADDEDIAAYLARSAEGLSSIAFFIQEDIQAFSSSDERTIAFRLSEPGVWAAAVTAERAADSRDAVYFRDLTLDLTGAAPLQVKAPFARLHGTTLTLRAVDSLNPDTVWEPEYVSGQRLQPRTGTGPLDPGYAIIVPFNQEDAASALRLSGAPADIPIALLATGIDDARRLGIETSPLLEELARRAGYPFAVLMLVLIGAGMGVRFKPTEPVSVTMKYLTAPLLVALALMPLRMVASVAAVAGKAFAYLIPSGLFLPAWLGFLGLCVVITLFIAARIAGRSGE